MEFYFFHIYLFLLIYFYILKIFLHHFKVFFICITCIHKIYILYMYNNKYAFFCCVQIYIKVYTKNLEKMFIKEFFLFVFRGWENNSFISSPCGSEFILKRFVSVYTENNSCFLLVFGVKIVVFENDSTKWFSVYSLPIDLLTNGISFSSK